MPFFPHILISFFIGYEDVSKSFRTESIMKSPLALVLLVAVPFKVYSFRVYATGPAFLPLLETPLELISWNRV
jgi:hypothetical protein